LWFLLLSIVFADVSFDYVNESIQASVQFFSTLSRFLCQFCDLAVHTIQCLVVALNDIRQTQDHISKLRDIDRIFTALLFLPGYSPRIELAAR